MKLEPDLIKELLEWGEENLPCYERSWLSDSIKIKDYSVDQITFHIYLLWKNDYIECTDSSAGITKLYFYDNLTMNGYQYLNLLRSKAWNAAKGLLHETGVIFAEAAIKALIDKAKLF